MRIIDVSVTFEQLKDCCDSESEYCQYLTVKTQNGGVHPSDTFFVIETQRWAFNKTDDIRAFADQLDNVLKLITTQTPEEAEDE